MKITIRPENKKDNSNVFMLHKAAFGSKKESVLVEDLRKNPKFIKELSIVALVDLEVAGHILLFPIEINNEKSSHQILSLAPLGVLPKYQNQGIGKKLIKYSVEAAADLGFEAIIVVGHPKYYPKLGFKEAKLSGIYPPVDGIPSEAFMVIEVLAGSLKNIRGKVSFPKEYYDAM